MTAKFVLLSNSAVKRDALVSLLSEDFVGTAAPGETDCPQPIGLEAAVECVFRRLQAAPKSPPETTFVVVENFLTADASHDNVLVLLFRDGKVDSAICGDERALIKVPDQYRDGLLRDAKAVGRFAIHGCEKTLGARIAENDASCKHDDWFQSVDAKNITRKAQIRIVLYQAFETSNKTSEAARMLCERIKTSNDLFDDSRDC